MNKKTSRPPQSADRFFRWYCQNELRESILGDLHERYEEYLETHSRITARRLYWLDVLRFMNRHTLKRKPKNLKTLTPSFMIRNYIIVAFRSFKRNKAFTGINIIGFGLSMAVCLLILVMVDNQMSYDEFNNNRENVYRMFHERLDAEIDLPIATTPLPLGAKLKDEYSGFKNVVRFRRGLNGEVIDNGKVIDVQGYFADPSVFEMFQFELAAGNQRNALEAPFSIILTAETAIKIFKDKDPVGETIDVKGVGPFTVTGVMKKLPGKSHVKFDALASYNSVVALENQELLPKDLNSWENTSVGWVYFEPEITFDFAAFDTYLASLTRDFYNEESEHIINFKVQKMTDITPGPLMGNQIGEALPNFFVYGLIVLAILIMTCAAFNYANLTAARSLSRLKEVGIRKVIGSTRKQLIGQFVCEAIIVSILSLALALAILTVMIPAFESLSISAILGMQLKVDTNLYLQFLAFSIIIGLVTGFIPALYMSKAKPITALRGLKAPRMTKIGLRKTLIVVQLVISVVLIISSTLVHRQIKYMTERDYGFDRSNIVNIDLQGQDFALLQKELNELPFVQKVSGADNIPNTGMHHDEDVRKLINDEKLNYNYFVVDEHYVDNLGLKIVAGRNFTPNQIEEKEIIINEAAVKSLQFENAEEAIGQNLILGDSLNVNIVGVVKDYNFMMLYMEILPMMLRYNTEEFSWAQVKIDQTAPMENIAAIEAVWNTFDPNHEFECQFFDAQIAEFYGTFYDIVYIIGLISILSVSIAAMGLLGIAMYAIQSRLKEVSIRKILGATINDLILVLGKGFFILIVSSTVIGGLLAFFGNKLWLDLFAYRVDFGLDVVGIAFGFIALISGLTIGLQTLKAAGTNPSDMLRNE